MIKQVGQAIALSGDQWGKEPMMTAAIDRLVDGLVQYLEDHHARIVERPKLGFNRGPDDSNPFDDRFTVFYRVTVDEP